jgi:general control protein GCN4
VPLFNANSTGNIPTVRQPAATNTMNDFATSFDGGLDAHFGAGLDASGDFTWDGTLTGFTSVNTGASSTQTVSPKDLFNDYMGSAPPSTAFTNLTSPDISGSPYGASSTEVSPLYRDTDDLGNADTSSWFSLFPNEPVAVAPSMERHDSNGQSSASSGSPLVLDQHNFRRKSSAPSGASPGHQRHSSINGVKPRRRKGPLPPIAVDPEDKTALKRARNTLAARESRQRKLDHLGTLEHRIKELETREEQFKAALAAYGYSGPLMHE